MLERRRALLSGLFSVVAASPAWSQQRRSLADPLRLGVDNALIDSGLAPALQRAFGSDTGVVVQLIAAPALPMLQALERGELDAGLCNAPDAEARLDQQGLVHDRRAVATGEFVLVGPRAPASGVVVLGAAHDAADALRRIQAAGASFLSANDGSGTHAAEQALWRTAGIAPVGPWYLAAEPNTSLIAQARARAAWALVERGAWAQTGGAPLALRVDGDPRLAAPVHVMRSFRVNHPAAKIFVAWISGAKGQRVVAVQRGYHVPTA